MNDNTNPITLISNHIEAVQPAFMSMLPKGVDINFAREAEFAVQIFSRPKQDFLIKCALENPASLQEAITNLAACRLSLNPVMKQAYLVPRKGGITLMISYMGMCDLAVSGGAIRWVQAHVVRMADTFRLNGDGRHPTHEYDPFASEADRGAIRGVYCVAKTIDSDLLIETMSMEAVYKVRDRSDAWKTFKAKGITCPWNTDEEEMIKKTVVRRAAKMWPKVDALKIAIAKTDNSGFDFGEYEETAATEVVPVQRAAMAMPKSKSAKAAEQAEDIGFKDQPGQATTKQEPAEAAPLASPNARGLLSRLLTQAGLQIADVAGPMGIKVADDLSDLTTTAFNALSKEVRRAIA